MKVTKNYFENFFFPLLRKEMTKDDIVCHLGDLFDNRNVIPIDVLNYAQYILEEISKICPLHIITGNHDYYNKSSGEINSVKPFNYIPNVNVYEKTTKIEYNGKSICLMPYIENKQEQIELLKEYSGCDYLFCHSDLNGAKMHLTSAGHRNNNKPDVSDFSGYKNIKSGHIHLKQSVGSITYVGSPFEMDRNDMNTEKGIFILDTNNDTERFIPNNISPKFKKISITTEDDLNLLDVNTKDWVDLSISNSLILDNRKIRRKLESILQEGSFASVEYIDDISTEKVEENIKPIDGELSINLNYDKYIEKHILDKNWDTVKTKNGVLNEYKKIIDIYSESNKKLL
jgi:DNA repair exonuclease SbcCD nuclease subunit